MKTGVQAVVSSLLGFILFGVLLFVPAGTFDYWQAWVFIAVFAAVSAVPSVYWILRKPEVVRRRMNAGPLAEARPAQKIASTAVFVVFAAVLAVSALDHRFGWSDVPLPVVVLGNVLVAIGLGLTMLVVEQNSYAAANVTVESGQKLVSTGLYGLVRHPMYFATQILMAGTCLALASYWGLAVLIPCLVVFGFRILDEEKMLNEELTGYREYTEKVRSRLVPFVW